MNIQTNELLETSKKSILITGCSTGIGYCAATTLKKRGYEVFTTARQPKDIEQLKSEGFHCSYLDYRNSDSISRTISSLLEKTNGKIYALFNNGAYGQPGAIEDLSRDTLREQFESNVFGWHELTNLVLPIMRQQGFGRVIQNSSILGLVSLKYRGAYNASKYAIEGLTDTLRLEFKNTGIFFSLIEPGPIRTAFRKNAHLKYQEFINPDTSFHKDAYEALEQRLSNQGLTGDAKFTLDSDAVVCKLIHALEANSPKNHYPVTIPAQLFSLLKRLLPSKIMDNLLYKASS